MEEYQQRLEQQQLERLKWSLRKACLRFMSTDAIAGALDLTFSQGSTERTLIVDELKTRLTQDDCQAKSAELLVRSLLATYESLGSNHKEHADRILRRLASVWPPTADRSWGWPLLEHRRKSHRMVAYSLFRRAADPSGYNLLIEAYHAYRDPECLSALALAASSFRLGRNAREILKALENDTYLQARIFQRMLEQEVENAESLAERYPHAFVWAVGRARARPFLPTVDRIRAKAGCDYRLLGLVVWTLVQLEEAERLTDMARDFELALL